MVQRPKRQMQSFGKARHTGNSGYFANGVGKLSFPTLRVGFRIFQELTWERDHVNEMLENLDV